MLGKTGTCSDNGTRFGWFTSYADTNYGRIVTVFFLEGGRPTFGPKAAELTGVFYRDLWDHSYFAEKNPAEAPAAGAMGQPAHGDRRHSVAGKNSTDNGLPERRPLSFAQ